MARKRYAKLLPIGCNRATVYVGSFDPDAGMDAWMQTYRAAGYVNPDERGNVWSRPGGDVQYIGLWSDDPREDAREAFRSAAWHDEVGRHDAACILVGTARNALAAAGITPDPLGR